MRQFFAAVSIAALTATLPASDGPTTRLIAIGDVHGGFDQFISILTRAQLIDGQRHWIGGNAILVQTGDVTDRGAAVRDVLELLMSLEKEATAAGGTVQVLLGNHEVMNMLGDRRDVSPDAIKSFGGEEKYREAFGPNGRYGRWLRSKPIIASIGGTVFMHAGINLDFTTETLDGLNKRARREIQQWDEGRKWLETQGRIKPSSDTYEVHQVARVEVDRANKIMAEQRHLETEVRRSAMLALPLANIGTSSLLAGDGPLWYRGFATWTDDEGAERVDALLKHHRVSRFVTGHTVQPNGQIRERFGGKVFLIDTGMLNGRFYPAGRPSALEIADGVAKPLYAEQLTDRLP